MPLRAFVVDDEQLAVQRLTRLLAGFQLIERLDRNVAVVFTTAFDRTRSKPSQ